MAKFRNVSVKFWSDPFIESLTPEKKYFFLYLITNEHTTQCGIYEISFRQMSFETGYNTETVAKLIEFFEKNGKIKYSKKTNELAIKNFVKHNPQGSPKVKAFVNKELLEVKDVDLILQMGYDLPEGIIARNTYRISDNRRQFIFERDGHKCKKCGSLDNLSVDHIIPISKGGKSIDENLRTLCRSCNSKRLLTMIDIKEEIEKEGFNFENLLDANEIAYKYPIGRHSQEEEEEEEEETKEQEQEKNEVTVWPSFEDFWNLYDKKQDKPKCLKKWEKIKQAAREKIMEHLELYVRSTPDIQYRKNPLTYLNSESWNNEIIIANGHSKKKSITGELAAALAERMAEDARLRQSQSSE